jgi:hypothetical protein
VEQMFLEKNKTNVHEKKVEQLFMLVHLVEQMFYWAAARDHS